MSFAAEVRARLPEGMQLPDPFEAIFDWCEAQGWRRVFNRHDPDDFQNHYLQIYPDAQVNDPAASFVLFSFEAGPPLHAPPPEVGARFVTLAKAAGDGGTLGLWLADDGAQRFVIFNHGSPHILTDDACVALKYLALGYVEPAALDDPTLDPLAQAMRDGYDPPLMPDAFRAQVVRICGGALPSSAAEMGITIPHFDDMSDPARQWLARAFPE